MTRLLLLAAACLQVVSACTNCVMLGKEEKAMFLAHSSACQAQSRVAPRLLAALLRGELSEDAALKRHVYCVLVKCKVLAKDGKLLKAAALHKLAKGDARNATKVLEQCAAQADDAAAAPEEVAWRLFRCGYQRKAVLFDYMPVAGDQHQ